ncbi:hypothetical protein FACS1894184_09940 [Clostridia bacterium]|nr:hypothetical protein FACS1894184_09940 [Clostridia bacterium]
MNIMQRWVCVGIILAVIMCAGAAGIAESSRSLVLEGTIAAGQIITLRPPYVGTVGTVNSKVGELTEVGEVITWMDKVTLYAPCDGVVGEVGALPGDEAAYITGQYGALMYIEPARKFTISASAKNAYNTDENKLIHVGETVYLRGLNDTFLVGTGIVTKVSGTSYSIDVLDYNFASGVTMYVYRDSAYASASRIGTGSVAAVANVAVTGDGTVFRILALQGAVVQRGDPLIELVSDTCLNIGALTDSVTAPSEAFVLTLDSKTGDTVKRGQSLATLAPLDSLIISTEVSDADIAFVRVGDPVGYRNAAMLVTERLDGTVAAISNVASNGTFTIYITIDYADWMKVGMGVDVL